MVRRAGGRLGKLPFDIELIEVGLKLCLADCRYDIWWFGICYVLCYALCLRQS